MGRIKSRAGQKIGRLYVIEKMKERTKSGCVIWLCKCDCGNHVKVSSRDFTIKKEEFPECNHVGV